MAALTQTGWGSSPTSAPDSPWECAHRHVYSRRGTPSCPDSHNGRGGPGQITLAHSLLTECGVEGTGSQGGEQGNFRPSVRGRVQLVTETHSLQCYRCQGWGHMAREWPTPASALYQPRGNCKNVAHSPTSYSCLR